MKLLLVEDEKIKRTALRDDLVEAGHETRMSASADEGMKLLEAESFDVVITDVRMKGMDGTTFLARIKETWPDTEVVVMTAYATIDHAVEAMRLGAFDYVTKPFESARLVKTLDNIAKINALEDEQNGLKAKLLDASRHGQIIGQSAAMRAVLDAVALAQSSEVPVLICGETGTGKERLATAIHEGGPRRDMPFVTVNCMTLSPQLMESELFGHEKGAFTGAIASKPSRFELADKGTLFFDELDDMPLEAQAKLLRVIEGSSFERVGGVTPINVDVRFLAASKVDLHKKVAAGTFREDLYYRISVFPIWIPPLRERPEDVPLFVEHFLEMYAPGSEAPQVDEEAMARLCDYSWPGNVRQVQNVVRRVLVGLGKRDIVTLQDIPPEIRQAAMQGRPAQEEPRSFRDTVEANERTLLVKALDGAGGNQSKAAASLNMALSTFRDKLAKYEIRAGSSRGRGQ